MNGVQAERWGRLGLVRRARRARGIEMPIPGARYRVKTTTKGKKVRLAWQGGKVVEAKNLKTGATHTPAEFAEDEAKRCERGHCGENFGGRK